MKRLGDQEIFESHRNIKLWKYTFASVFSVIVSYSSPILTLNLTIEQDAMLKPLLIKKETEALEEFQSFLLFPSILE